jgi:hypothetical protein
METSAHEVTRLLQAWSAGEQSAFDKLVPMVYQELHRLAQHYMAQERPGHSLQTTALVHEAYLRLVGGVHSTCLLRTRVPATCFLCVKTR